MYLVNKKHSIKPQEKAINYYLNEKSKLPKGVYELTQQNEKIIK